MIDEMDEWMERGMMNEDRGYGDNIGDFRRMYGKDAEQINVTNVVEISKTMNKKFLEK